MCADMQDCWLGYDEEAMRLLAETYQNGEVVDQDSASAEYWLKKADERKVQNSL